MANQFGRAPRWQCRLCYLSDGVHCPTGKLLNFRTSELPNASPLLARLLRSVPSGVFSLRRDGGRARQRSWVTMLLRNRRLGCCFAGVDPIDWEKQASERTLRVWGHFGSIGIAFSPADLPAQEGEKRRSRKATFANQLRGVVAFAESP